ncbi:MAG: hypothetical protein ACRDHY_07315 [Anaerolineales bacterium]
MEAPSIRPPAPPIGVLASLAAGFDRVASHPALLLPPILLDLFLWFGPPLRMTSLIGEATRVLTDLAASDPAMVDRVRLIQADMAEVALRFNLFSALSSVPVGIPSLMAARLPPASPLGVMASFEVTSAGAALAIWGSLQVIGLGLGSAYHREIARLHAPDLAPGGGWSLWGRMLLAGLLTYVGAMGAALITTLLVSLAALVIPILAVGVLFIGLSLLTWVAIYLAFTPHGMVRYRFGILKAMVESFILVRGNLFGVVGFLGLAFLISWLAGMLWELPDETSWLNLLALFGHSVVSAALLAASYAFYQGRWEWLARFRAAAAAQTGA